MCMRGTEDVDTAGHVHVYSTCAHLYHTLPVSVPSWVSWGSPWGTISVALQSHNTAITCDKGREGERVSVYVREYNN